MTNEQEQTIPPEVAELRKVIEGSKTIIAELQRDLRIAKAHEAASDEANKTLAKEIAELRSLLSEARKVPEGCAIVPKEVVDFYSFATMVFEPFTSQQEQLMISLRKAKAAMAELNKRKGDM